MAADEHCGGRRRWRSPRQKDCCALIASGAHSSAAVETCGVLPAGRPRGVLFYQHHTTTTTQPPKPQMQLNLQHPLAHSLDEVRDHVVRQVEPRAPTRWARRWEPKGPRDVAPSLPKRFTRLCPRRHGEQVAPAGVALTPWALASHFILARRAPRLSPLGCGIRVAQHRPRHTARWRRWHRTKRCARVEA